MLAILLLSLTAEAQTAYPCGNAACVGTAGEDVKLGGTVTETRGAWPDAGLAILKPTVAGATLTLQGIQPAATTAAPDVIIRSSNTRTTGKILSVRSNQAEVFSINGTGPSSASGGFDLIDAGTINVMGLATIVAIDAGSGNVVGVWKAGTLKGDIIDAGSLMVVGITQLGAGAKVAGTNIGTGSSQDGGTGTPSFQWGYSALTANELAVTFTRAFSANPSCVCSHTETTNANACGIKTGTAPSTTAVTFSVASGGSDVVFWQCMGHQ